MHGLQPVARRLAPLADEDQVRFGEACYDVALRDELGVVRDRAARAALEEGGGHLRNVAGQHCAAYDHVLVAPSQLAW